MELRQPPTDYREWLEVFRILEKRSLHSEEWEMLSRGTIYGFDRVQEQFLEKLEHVINEMLKRATKRCTKALIISLEDGDYSSLQMILRRGKRELDECRFSRELTFLPREIAEDLDRQVLETIRNYWQEWIKNMKEAAMESEQRDVFDMLYYLRRLEREYGKL